MLTNTGVGMMLPRPHLGGSPQHRPFLPRDSGDLSNDAVRLFSWGEVQISCMCGTFPIRKPHRPFVG